MGSIYTIYKQSLDANMYPLYYSQTSVPFFIQQIAVGLGPMKNAVLE